jgi:hypothetical protein
MNRAKSTVSSVGSGSGSVVAAGNEMGGVIVVGIAVATGVDAVAFFADFFLLEGAGIVFRGYDVWWGSEICAGSLRMVRRGWYLIEE